MGAVVRSSGWEGAPGWLVLPEPPAGTPARDLVEQALAQLPTMADQPCPAALALAAGSWRLDGRELRAVAERMASHGVCLAGVTGQNPHTRVAAAALGLPTNAPLQPAEPSAAGAGPGSCGFTLHQGTLRAGDHLEAEGSLLVLGDVNPGARVSAAGDVLVWGRLRGSAHAGCHGAHSARIVALQLRPLQLRIANAVARGPEDLPPAGLAEQAVLVDGVIRLEAADPIWPLSD